METPEILPEHRWLAQLVGEWRSEMELPSPDGGSPIIVRGTETVRLIGDLWLHLEGRSEMPGCGESHNIMSVGFDPKSGRFVGTWMGSMMNYMWSYKGTLDQAAGVLTLESIGPRFDESGESALYHDMITIVDSSHRVLNGKVQTREGGWDSVCEVHYYRV